VKILVEVNSRATNQEIIPPSSWGYSHEIALTAFLICQISYQAKIVGALAQQDTFNLELAEHP